ncbi:TetR family transcriptional regulator C-terminal domain-containing protein [Amycolatopsis sp. NPDC005232]|uniref:TetR/AcrR family transcriptional regulator n=1 Tax=Amycolatopsis sp. NPDC005232 TaxID=3157027 RepID=UPI0033B2BEFB
MAAESGLNIGSVRHYFDGQRDLMRFATRSTIDRVTARLERRRVSLRPLSELTPDEAASQLTDFLAELLPLDAPRRAEATVLVEFLVAARVDTDLTALAHEALRGTLTLARRIIEAMRLPASAADLEAERLAALLDGLTFRSALQPDATTPQVCRDVLRVHLASLGSEQTPRPRPTRERPRRHRTRPSTVDIHDHLLEPPQHPRREGEPRDSERPQRLAMIDCDGRQRPQQQNPPPAGDDFSLCPGESPSELITVERHMPLLIRQNPRRDFLRERIAGAIPQRPVVAQRHDFGDQEHHQLQPEPERPPEPDEHGVRPVVVDRRTPRGPEEFGQQPRVVLLLGHEQLDGGPKPRVRLGDQVGPVPRLPHLEPLHAPHHQGVQPRPAPPLRLRPHSPPLCFFPELPEPLHAPDAVAPM